MAVQQDCCEPAANTSSLILPVHGSLGCAAIHNSNCTSQTKTTAFSSFSEPFIPVMPVYFASLSLKKPDTGAHCAD